MQKKKKKKTLKSYVSIHEIEKKRESVKIGRTLLLLTYATYCTMHEITNSLQHFIYLDNTYCNTCCLLFYEQ